MEIDAESETTARKKADTGCKKFPANLIIESYEF
nr:phosphoribosylformylglycinamidine synthase subunit PurS [Pedobacter mongoliensis]